MKPKMSMLLNSLISIVVILSFLSTTINVYAEDEQPQAVDSVIVTQPPTDPPAVSTDTVVTITVPDVASSTPEPVVQTDTAANDQDIQRVQVSTGEPTAEGQPINASVEPSPSLKPTEQETQLPAAVLEMIDTLRVDTDLVVQDTDGNTLPLASIAAEAVIASGDPVWCPAGSKPGDLGCTASFTHFNGVDGLIAALAADATKTGGGTIYVSYDYAATVANGDQTDIIFDHLMLNNLTDLVFQGGWDFVSNSLNSTSTFDLGAGALQFLNWGNKLTIKDIIENSAGGLVIDQTTGTSTAKVTLNNVEVHGSGDDIAQEPGAKINTSGNVIVNDSIITGKYGGLNITSLGNITLNNVGGGSNYGDSARLDNSSGTGNIAMADTTFSGSSNGNLVVLSKGDISFNNITASGSGGPGINAYLNNTYGTGSIMMSGSNVFGRAGGDGLVVYSNGDIILNNVDSSRGVGIGAYLDNSTGTGDVILTGTNDFSRGQGGGLFVYSKGDITLNNIDGSRTGGLGAYLDNSTGTGNVTLTGTNDFSAGSGGCLTVLSNGDISISNLLADRAGGSGTLLDNSTGTGNVTLTGTNDFDSGHTGLRVLSAGDIALNNIAASGVGSDGAYLNNAFGTGSVTLTGTNVFGRYTDDGYPIYGSAGYGLDIISHGDVALNNVQADFNRAGGAFIDNCDVVGEICTGSGDVTLTGVNEFNGNHFAGSNITGLEIFSNGSMFLNNIAANQNNGFGAYLDNSFGTGTILFSGTNTFIDNGLENLVMHTSSNTPTVTPTPDVPTPGDTLTDAPSIGIEPMENLLPLLVPVTGGGGFNAFNCNAVTILRLPTSDFVMASSDFCNLQGELTQQLKEVLPADLPAGGPTFEFGMNLTVLDGLTPLTFIADPGRLTFSFRIPAELHAKEITVLFWDATLLNGAGDWVELPAYTEKEDGTPIITSLHAEEPSEARMILAGVQKTELYRVEFVTNFPGLFILAVN